MAGETNHKPANGNTRIWRQVLVALGLVFLGVLAFSLFRPVPAGWPWHYTYIAVPLGGVLIAIILGLFIYEIFAIDLAFLVDTIRFLARKVLPRRWRQPVSLALTRWWARAPAWMHTNVWMPDDEEQGDRSSVPPDDDQIGRKF